MSSSPPPAASRVSGPIQPSQDPLEAGLARASQPAEPPRVPTPLAPSPGEQPALSRWIARIVLAAVVALGVGAFNMVIWKKAHPTVDAPEIAGDVAGFAYNSFGRWDSPLEQRFPEYESVERDLQLMVEHTQRIRTYSSSELPALPALAEARGLYVTAGVWIDPRRDNSEKEIAALEQAVRTTSNIERVMVGNEQILTGAMTVDQMIGYLDDVKRRVRKPVSTAEPWHVWLRNPKLADHVDFITVHLLPYWEGLPVKEALEYTFERLEQVQRRFPDKHVVIGEVGWPSQGDRRMGSYATPAAQAEFIRGFLARAQRGRVDYYLMEAIDQPWKIDNEGRAGPYWGVMNADRTLKFSLRGPIETDPHWRTKAAIASTLGVLAIFAFFYYNRSLRLASKVAFGIALQAVVALGVWLIAIPFDYYMRPFDWVFLFVLVPSLFAMSAILLANGFEFVEMFWKGNLHRRFGSCPLTAGAPQPKVSLHLACCNEPPDMVIATIQSLANLDYRNLEVLVIDNNTRDEALWKPVEAFMETLDERFRFFHLPSWPGYKAGALNFALSQTAPDADVVGVVDADYVVVRRWLSNVMGYFQDPLVAVVQAPQAHRGWTRHVFRRMMSFEYDGFFRIGMHHRNERNAIIQHGTMTLIRADALRSHGNWSEWCICEDAELGLRLMDAGYSTVYVDQVVGRGLTPDTFLAFKKQRRRWAEGAMQILRGQAGMLFGRSRLSPGQRYHFIAGWFSWLGDALHLVFALGAMAWSVGIIARPDIFTLPILLYMIPLLIFFVVKAGMGPLLYLRRVRCSGRDILGAALAGMALSHGIARGVFAGLTRKTAVFEITEKGSGAPSPAQPASAVSASPPAAAPPRSGRVRTPPDKAWGGVREEAFLLAGLLVSAIGVAVWRLPNHFESSMWILILLLQAVPYAAALVCALLSQLPDHSERAAVRRMKRQPVQQV